MCKCGLQGAHVEALGELFHAWRLVPGEPLLLLSLGVAYTNQAMTKKVPDRDRAVLQGFAWLQEYAAARGSPQEAAYNLGRAAQQLGLFHIAVPYYQQALRCVGAPSAGAARVCDSALTLAHCIQQRNARDNSFCLMFWLLL